MEYLVAVLRRDANIKTPVKQRAADAVTFTDLERMLQKAQNVKLTIGERRALDILSIAFSTMSRVSEIAALKASDVRADGSVILIRPKHPQKHGRN